MKNTVLKTIVVMALAVLLSAIFAQTSVFAQEAEKEPTPDMTEQNFGNRSIEGVWQTTVTPVNCQTGDPVAPSFQGLLTFNNGGTLAETSSLTGPALRSAGHGIWKRSWGWQRFSMAFIFLRYNAANALIGSSRIRQVVQINDDDSTSTGTVEIIDLNGNVIATGCSTATATRFE